MARKRSRRRSRDARAEGVDSDTRSPSAENREHRQTAGGDREPRGRREAGSGLEHRPDSTVARTPSAADEASGDYVAYEAGSGRASRSDSHGLDVGQRERGKLQRLEAAFGSEQVSRWAEEGMPVEAMGKPRDMQAFREGESDDGGSSPTAAGRRDHGAPQPKLAVSSPDDPAEKEAEEVAEQVVGSSGGSTGDRADERQSLASKARAPPSAGIDRSAGGGAVSEGAASTVRKGVQGGGKPLGAETGRSFESKMGADFSDVSVHTDSTADQAAKSINATAYTLGSDIAFASGAYNPNSQGGQQLLAHELTHVVQQGAADSAERSPSVRRTAGMQVQRGLFSDAASSIKSAAESAKDTAESAAESAKDTAKSAAESAKETGKAAVESATQTVDTLASEARNLGEQAWDIVETGGQQVWDTLKQRGSALVSVVKNGGQRAWDTLKQSGDALVSMVENGGQRAWDVLKQGGQRLWDVAQNAGSQVWDVLERGGQRLWSLLQRNQQLLVQMIQNGGQRVWSILARGGQRLWGILQRGGRRVWSALRSVGHQFWNFLRQSADRLWSAIRNGGQWIWHVLSGVRHRVVNFLAQVPQRLLDFVRTLRRAGLPMPSWLWQGLKRLLTNPAALGQWVLNGLRNAASRVTGLINRLISVVGLGPVRDAVNLLTKLDIRPLSAEEATEGEKALGGTVSYGAVRIDEHSLIATLGREIQSADSMAVTTFHVINFTEPINPSAGGSEMAWLVHELTHVAQFETVGSRYLPEAVHAQTAGAGYEYSYTDLDNESLDYFNREQQASIIEDYYARVLYSTNRAARVTGAPSDFFSNYDSDYAGTYESHISALQSGRL